MKLLRNVLVLTLTLTCASCTEAPPEVTAQAAQWAVEAKNLCLASGGLPTATQVESFTVSRNAVSLVRCSFSKEKAEVQP